VNFPAGTRFILIPFASVISLDDVAVGGNAGVLVSVGKTGVKVKVGGGGVKVGLGLGLICIEVQGARKTQRQSRSFLFMFKILLRTLCPRRGARGREILSGDG
jgi:hypothetical protein